MLHCKESSLIMMYATQILPFTQALTFFPLLLGELESETSFTGQCGGIEQEVNLLDCEKEQDHKGTQAMGLLGGAKQAP